MQGVLNEVGWVDDVIINRRTGKLVDGHLRVELAASHGPETPVPVKYVDLSEAEEALILAIFDPIFAVAETDKVALDTLMREIQSGEASVQEFVAGLAQREGIVSPEFSPVGIDGQGRLDQKKMVKCPECGNEFVPAS